MSTTPLSVTLKRHTASFHSVVPFDPARDLLYPLDFTERNTNLNPDEIADTERFAAYINKTLKAHGARYGIGGYGEHRPWSFQAAIQVKDGDKATEAEGIQLTKRIKVDGIRDR